MKFVGLDHVQLALIVRHSVHGRLILVTFTESGQDIRIITARRATRNERTDYEAAAST